MTEKALWLKRADDALALYFTSIHGAALLAGLRPLPLSGPHTVSDSPASRIPLTRLTLSDHLGDPTWTSLGS